VPFLFCACQPGAERLLKAEVRRVRPDLRPAFARPGLVTFKGDGPPPELVFARVSGTSLGAAASVDEAVALARPAGARRVHAWAREGGPDPALAAALAAALGVPADPRPRRRELVLDAIVAPGEPLFLGVHAHGPETSPLPGGLPAAEVPPEAPSRAYAKVEEALAWSGLSPAPGETALEIGSAPGGASYALLRRGLRVVGVDPGEMAEVVRADPGFRHVKTAVGGLRREDLPPRVAWLLLDVNLAPQVALHAVRRLVPMIRPSLLAAILTLKLNEERFVDEIPAWLGRVREMGFRDVRARQLPSNRREICVAARR
jgi:23S rRNA (cytidine2498-2'-O)-methyltransferase